jgi:hypothetical protein
MESVKLEPTNYPHLNVQEILERDRKEKRKEYNKRYKEKLIKTATWMGDPNIF